MAAIKALEQWCKMQCEGYRDVAITNMTTSFRNGMAFFDGCWLNFVYFNFSLKAFQIAEEKLGIPALLDAEDMVALRIPDRLSILTYVSQYHNYFKGRPPMGGVKRPAEGSKEEPSEKKNLPVVAKTFVSKTAIENRLPSALTAQTSPKLARAAAQKAVLAENANKTGTLNSKCVACKNHVHLVQRHFVEGKLYHRSCFKCSECSSVLHAGGYKPGKNPDTFICNAHQSSCKPSPSEVGIKNGPTSSAVRSNGASQTQPAPLRPSSVLSAPLNVIRKPVSPTPPSQSWTASAQKTQAARQRFFQAAPPLTQASADNRKPTEPSSVLGRPKVPLSSNDEKSRARTTIGKKLAEENCNNNNKRPPMVRAFSLHRFGDEPSSADSPGLRNDKCSQGPAGNWARQLSTSQTNNKEQSCLKAINKDNTRPTTVHTTAKGRLTLKFFVLYQVKSYHMSVEQIERELNDIETNLAQLEKDGVELEKKLRSCEEEGEGDILMDPLMVDWFNLIRKKQMYIRKESELVYIARTRELEQQQPGVEGELRRLLEKPDHLKSREEQQQETLLMQRLMDIVDGRNAIVEGLDEDRLREVEEDQQLNEMMKNLGVKKAKNKRKSSISKMFRRRKLGE
uniref:Mical-like 2a n=1 Tax=Lates calcarifer TaxID=8187 RepID=A0A4W6BXX4_LATCA